MHATWGFPFCASQNPIPQTGPSIPGLLPHDCSPKLVTLSPSLTLQFATPTALGLNPGARSRSNSGFVIPRLDGQRIATNVFSFQESHGLPSVAFRSRIQRITIPRDLPDLANSLGFSGAIVVPCRAAIEIPVPWSSMVAFLGPSKPVMIPKQGGAAVYRKVV